MLYLNGYTPKAKKEFNAQEIDAIKQFSYDTHLGAFGQSAKGYMANNAADSYGEFIALEATYLMPELLMRKYPDIKYREALPVINAGGFAKDLRTTMYDVTGESRTQAEVVNGVQLVDAFQKSEIYSILERTVGMKWDFSELKAAQQFGTYIDQSKLVAVKRSLELLVNDLVLFGDPSSGKSGLLTDVSITRVTAAVGASGSTQWKNKTQKEIIADIQAGYVALNDRSESVFDANSVYMSNKTYNQTVAVFRSEFSDITINAYLGGYLPTVQTVIPDVFLNGKGNKVDPAFPGEDTNVMVFMAKDSENFFVNNAVEMTATPVNYEGTQMILPYMARSSGFVLRRAPSILILEGI